MRKGKQSAVGNKTGNSVANSGPVLRPPTPLPRAARKTAACPSHPQPQSWPGCGAGSPAQGAAREADALPLTDADVSELIAFFRVLDSWDCEEKNVKAV